MWRKCFHPLSGFSSYLFNMKMDKRKRVYLFPSPVGVFFLFIMKSAEQAIEVLKFPSPVGVFFLFIQRMTNGMYGGFEFPSPVGVFFLFILTSLRENFTKMFPSPVGVFFLFITKHISLWSMISTSFHPLSGFSSYIQ